MNIPTPRDDDPAATHPGDSIHRAATYQKGAPANTIITAAPVAGLHETDNLGVAAALITLGVPFDDPASSGVHRVTGAGIAGDGGRMVFGFHGSSPDGTVLTERVMLLWSDIGWHHENPDSPLAWMRCFHSSRRAFATAVKTGAPLVGNVHGNLTWWHAGRDIPVITAPAEPVDSTLFSTGNLGITAALASLGIPFRMTDAGTVVHVSSGRIIDPSGTKHFSFEPAGNGHITSDLIGRWDDRDWCHATTTHPLAWMRCFHVNYRAIMRRIKHAAPMVRFVHGSLEMFLPATADRATQDAFTRRLGI